MAINGDVGIQAYSVPALRSGQEYELKATQTVAFTPILPHDASPAPIETTSSFKTTISARYTLDKSLVHSVYPAPNHAAFWFTLPHIVFENAQVPWTFATSQDKSPYFGLVVFRDSELSVAPDVLSQLQFGLGLDNVPSVSTTKAIRLDQTKYWQSLAIKPTFITPAPQKSLEIISVSPTLFNTLVKRKDEFSLLSHVRTVNGVKDTSSFPTDVGKFAVTVSPRTGPGDISVPTLVHAHLIDLSGLASSGGDADSDARATLISLYSWSYICTPSLHLGLTDQFRQLQSTLRPLRSSLYDATSNTSSEANTWVSARIACGYTMGKFIATTGESMICVYRGMLSPIPHVDDGVAPSNHGEDLLIVDGEMGVVDVTYQLAWELGRLQCISDRQVSAAVMRLRGRIHKQGVSMAKTELDTKFTSISDTLTKTRADLRQLCDPVRKDTSIVNPRWESAKTRPGLRAELNFETDKVRQKYAEDLAAAARKIIVPPPENDNFVAMAVPVTAPRQTSSGAQSSDFELLANWLIDRLSLKGMPWCNLIVDPTLSLPHESLRTFHIDRSWYKAFVDGALSVGEHFTIDDEARECIKHCLDLEMKHKTVPRWGLIIRSNIVNKFPGLEVVAHHGDGSEDHGTRVTVDADTLIVLFPEAPGDIGFAQSITIAPPGHQLSFSLGDSASWKSRKDRRLESLRLPLRPAAFVDNAANQVALTPDDAVPLLYTPSTETVRGYDFENSMLIPSDVLKDLEKGLKNYHPDAANSSAALGAQLISRLPFISLQASQNDARHPVLTTTTTSLFTSAVKRISINETTLSEDALDLGAEAPRTAMLFSANNAPNTTEPDSITAFAPPPAPVRLMAAGPPPPPMYKFTMPDISAQINADIQRKINEGMRFNIPDPNQQFKDDIQKKIDEQIKNSVPQVPVAPPNIPPPSIKPAAPNYNFTMPDLNRQINDDIKRKIDEQMRNLVPGPPAPAPTPTPAPTPPAPRPPVPSPPNFEISLPNISQQISDDIKRRIEDQLKNPNLPIPTVAPGVPAPTGPRPPGIPSYGWQPHIDIGLPDFGYHPHIDIGLPDFKGDIQKAIDDAIKNGTFLKFGPVGDNVLPFVGQMSNLNWTDRSLAQQYLSYDTQGPNSRPADDGGVQPSLKIRLYNAQTRIALLPSYPQPLRRHMYAIAAPINFPGAGSVVNFPINTDIHMLCQASRPLGDYKQITLTLPASNVNTNACMLPLPEKTAAFDANLPKLPTTEADFAARPHKLGPAPCQVVILGPAARYLTAKATWISVDNLQGDGSLVVDITPRRQANLFDNAQHVQVDIELKIVKMRCNWAGTSAGPRAKSYEFTWIERYNSGNVDSVEAVGQVNVYAFNVMTGTILGSS